MPYNAKISQNHKKAGWKVKISEKETCEPPHMTVCFKTKRWRVNLRNLEFMDKSPDPKEIPKSLLKEILKTKFVQNMKDEWDRKYPENTV